MIIEKDLLTELANKVDITKPAWQESKEANDYEIACLVTALESIKKAFKQDITKI